MKTKTNDCVKMKRSAQENIRRQLKGRSAMEEIAFFQQGADAFVGAIAEARRVARNGRSAHNEH